MANKQSVKIIAAVLFAMSFYSIIPKGECAPKLRAELLTDVPISLGVGGLAEFQDQWRISTSVGLMPRSYVALSNAVVMKFPYTYTEPTAELIEDTIQNSLVWSVMAGWSPRSLGLYTHVGYRLVTLGGGATAAALIEGITGQMVGDGSAADSNREPIMIDAASTLHMLGLEIGWEWPIMTLEAEQKLTLRASIGWSYTVHSSADLGVDLTGRRPRVQEALTQLELEGEEYLIDTFDSYVHPPTMSLALGYQWN